MKRNWIWLAALAFAACRNAKDNSSSLPGVNLVPSPFAAGGCSGPNQAFAPPQVPAALALALLDIEPGWSQVTAAGDAEVLYATGAGATVVEIDVSSATPSELELVGPGVVDALLAQAGIAAPAQLSGIAVLDATTLLVVEHTSNTLLSVDRVRVGRVAFYAGEPNTEGGFADGLAIRPNGAPQPPARFDFSRPTQVVATDPSVPFVVVADVGNHAVRLIDASGFVQTLAGAGSAFFADGDLSDAGFDTPVGLSLTCTGGVVISEAGAAGAGGQRVRQMTTGSFTFFGTLDGEVLTLAGDGASATIEGDGVLASTAAPASPLATADGDVYWVDSESGILRRMRGPQNTVDCPLWNDCSQAVGAGGDFTPAGLHSLTQTPGGILFVLDADQEALLRVTP